MNKSHHLQQIVSQAKLLHSEVDIEDAIDNVARSITTELEHSNPIFICVLVGALILSGKLVEKLSFPLQLDYAHATRYGDDANGANNVNWLAKPSLPLSNRNIVLIDDVLDGGLTLAAIKEYCEQQNCKKVYTAVLLDKPSGRKPGGIDKPDFKGITIGDHWLIGTGLDYKGYLRNLTGIYAMDKSSVLEEYSNS